MEGEKNKENRKN